jgi:preprotein translocase subunit SecA
MTGTAQAAADELKEFYDLDVMVIPPNRPCIRNDEPDLIFTLEMDTPQLFKTVLPDRSKS